MPLPESFMRWNRALRGAFLKGVDAGLAGEPITACPYQDKRKPSGLISWSRGFIKAWDDGWDYATTNREDALITLNYRHSCMRAKGRKETR